MWLVVVFLLLLVVSFIIGSVIFIVRHRNRVDDVTDAAASKIDALTDAVSRNNKTIQSLETQFQQHVDLVKAAQNNMLIEMSTRNSEIDQLYTGLEDRVVDQEMSLHYYFKKHSEDVEALESSLSNMNAEFVTQRLQVDESVSIGDTLLVNGLASFPGSLQASQGTFSNLCVEDVCINRSDLSKMKQTI